MVYRRVTIWHNLIVCKSGCVQHQHPLLFAVAKYVLCEFVCDKDAFIHQAYRWGNIIYEGEVSEGKRHGQGTMSFTDAPMMYVGQWTDGKRHGEGTLYFNQGHTALYQGTAG